MTLRPYLACGIALLGAGAIVASAPSAVASGGASGHGGTTITGPGGTVIGSTSGQIAGTETVPGGLSGLPACIGGACSGSLTGSIGPGGGPTPVGSPGGLQITSKVTVPGGNPVNCITVGCSGNLNGVGGVTTPIIGVTGDLGGGIHG